MMPSKVTVTGKTGPGNTLTATVINGLSGVTLDFDNELLIPIIAGQPQPAIDIAAAATLTLTVVAPNSYTLTIS